MNILNLLLNASPFLIDPSKNGGIDNNGNIVVGDTKLDGTISVIEKIAGNGTLSIFDWGVKVIAIIFVLAVLLMIMAFIFKNGQWQKWGQSTMMISFVAMLLIRAIPIIILSFRSEMDVTESLNGALGALSQVAIFLGVVGIMLSLLFKFAYKLIEHPEYHRWSKNVLNVSVLMMILALGGPVIFGII